LYDPNYSDSVSTISIEFGEQLLDGRKDRDPAVRLRGFFCEVYTFSDPTGEVEGERNEEAE